MKKYYLLIFLVSNVLFFSCNTERVVKANLDMLHKDSDPESIDLFGRNAQELSPKKVEPITAKGVDYFTQEGELHLKLKNPNASIRISTTSLALPKSWKPFHELKIEMENMTSQDIKANILLWSARGRLPDTLLIPAQRAAHININLHDLPLIGNPTEKYHVNRIELEFANQQSSKVILKSVSLIDKGFEKDYVVMDKFGQRMSTQWPGKMQSEGEFAQHLRNEQNSLQDLFNSNEYDEYLGLKEDKSHRGNGFFSVGSDVENGQERWFFITPEGNPFWSYGVTCIRPKKPLHGTTLVKGNEQLFEQLPDRNGQYATAYVDSTLSFYNLNLLRKYGNLQKWRDMSYQRLRSWGLNTIGNWAEDTLLMQSKMPFTYSFETTIKSWSKDVYNPAWEQYVDSVFSSAAQLKDNKYLLGYFVDNESGWGNLKLLQTLPKDAFLRAEWIDKLKEQFTSINAFNNNNQSEFESWEELSLCEDPEKIARRHIVMLDELYTEKYFSTIAQTLRKYDPNHLYMGCRFTRKLKPAHILKIAGEYCDVITVNVYSYEPIKKDMDKWHELTGKPILIGEHQAALRGQRQLPLRWQTFDHEERYEYFTNYVSKWAHMPYSLGSHWYQYADQHITGRASNGENQVIGFVDITDQPYERMIDAARHNFNHIYQWMGLKAETAMQ